MKLRLFALRNTSTNKVTPGLFFSNKPDAKRARDEAGKEYVLTYGPDHHKYKV